jgi:hypothetical protein
MKKLTATQEKMRVKKLADAREALQSDDESLVLKGISEIKKHGDSSILEVIAQTYLRLDDQEIRKAITALLHSLKDDDAVKELIRLSEVEEYTAIHSLLLSSIWESGINSGPHLVALTKRSLTADYDSLLEIMTIVDNAEGSASPEQIEEALALIQEHLSEAPKDDRAGLWVTISRSLSAQLVG